MTSPLSSSTHCYIPFFPQPIVAVILPHPLLPFCYLLPLPLSSLGPSDFYSFPVLSCRKASWCSGLLSQQHSKVKSLEKKREFLLMYNYHMQSSHLRRVTVFRLDYRLDRIRLNQGEVCRNYNNRRGILLFKPQTSKPQKTRQMGCNTGESRSGQRGVKDTLTVTKSVNLRHVLP